MISKNLKSMFYLKTSYPLNITWCTSQRNSWPKIEAAILDLSSWSGDVWIVKFYFCGVWARFDIRRSDFEFPWTWCLYYFSIKLREKIKLFFMVQVTRMICASATFQVYAYPTNKRAYVGWKATWRIRSY